MKKIFLIILLAGCVYGQVKIKTHYSSECVNGRIVHSKLIQAINKMPDLLDYTTTGNAIAVHMNAIDVCSDCQIAIVIVVVIDFDNIEYYHGNNIYMIGIDRTDDVVDLIMSDIINVVTELRDDIKNTIKD